MLVKDAAVAGHTLPLDMLLKLVLNKRVNILTLLKMVIATMTQP